VIYLSKQGQVEIAEKGEYILTHDIAASTPMIPTDILFKINSETDEKQLIELYNKIAKRINVLRSHVNISKAEIKKEDKINVLDSKF